MNRNFASRKSRNLCRVDIDAKDMVSRVCQTRSSHKTDVTGSKDRNSHIYVPCGSDVAFSYVVKERAKTGSGI